MFGIFKKEKSLDKVLLEAFENKIVLYRELLGEAKEELSKLKIKLEEKSSRVISLIKENQKLKNENSALRGEIDFYKNEVERLRKSEKNSNMLLKDIWEELQKKDRKRSESYKSIRNDIDRMASDLQHMDFNMGVIVEEVKETKNIIKEELKAKEEKKEIEENIESLLKRLDTYA